MNGKWFVPVLVLLLGLGSISTAATAAETPNIVMIISDDQAWGDFGFMGHPVVKTPNIDKLASQSLVFTRGYVPSSLCRPSLAAMVTGLYPHQHKITSNDPPRGVPKDEFLRQRQLMIDNIDRVPTLPRLLAKKGYVSMQTGKWWEGNHSRGGFTSGMTHGDPKRGGRHGDAGLKIGREGMQPIYDFIDGATGSKKPFFLWYAPFLPHSPHNPPQKILDKYRDKTDSIQVAKYWAMCDWFDQTCGELLDYLDRKKLADNTLVLFVVDNGWIQQTNSGRYAPRSKQSQYDGGVRSPIMLRWPGHVKPRVDKEHLAISIDFAPTILDACGLKPTPEMQGINLLDEKAVDRRKAIFGEIFEHNAVDINDPATSLRYRWSIDGPWKLILPNKKNEPGGAVELYNVIDDPYEKKNLAAAEPARVKAIWGKIDLWYPANPQGHPRKKLQKNGS